MNVNPTLRLLTILLVNGFIACVNPFTTRDPEPPGQNPSTFIPPTAPEIVFINLQNAIRERNVENYIRSLVDTTRSSQRFAFVPDQGVAANHPGVFTGWGLADERRYLTNLLQATPADSGRSLLFTEVDRDEDATSATIEQRYMLVIRHTRQRGIPSLFLGQAKFFLERNTTGDWAIYRWEDFSDGVNPSWSELKALFQ